VRFLWQTEFNQRSGSQFLLIRILTVPISSFPSVGDLVTVSVKRVLPFGLHVTLDDGQPGIIRARELPRSADLIDVSVAEQYKIGEALAAVVVAREPDKQIELSLRLAQNDPWADLPQRYKAGQLITGIVTGVQAYGVFLEIGPGVAGLLHNTQLPPWPGLESSNLFWPGDHVKAIIDKIDLRQRRISLSLRDVSRRRWEGIPAALQSGKRPVTTQVVSSAAPPQLPLQLWLKTRPQAILVVEDDDDQRMAVANWLRNAGQQVVVAASAEEAWDILRNGYTPDLVLADVGLPGQNGLAMVQAMLSQQPEARYVIMTDWARAEEYSAQLENLRIAGVHLLIAILAR
jgi:CheY-like chemotaxis protein